MITLQLIQAKHSGWYLYSPATCRGPIGDHEVRNRTRGLKVTPLSPLFLSYTPFIPKDSADASLPQGQILTQNQFSCSQEGTACHLSQQSSNIPTMHQDLWHIPLLAQPWAFQENGPSQPLKSDLRPCLRWSSGCCGQKESNFQDWQLWSDTL